MQFVRKLAIRIIVKETPSLKRGFLFHVSAGFTSASGKVDHDSGMLVDLPQVDEWLEKLKVMLESQAILMPEGILADAFCEILKKSRLKLQQLAQSENCRLVSLKFQEERDWGFFWSESQKDHCTRIYRKHFVELIDREQGFQLLKVNFIWAQIAGCTADLHGEGFRILKNLGAVTKMSELAKLLGPFVRPEKRHEIKTGSYLESIEIESKFPVSKIQL